MKTVEIAIQGPIGTGKTILASIIANSFKNYGINTNLENDQTISQKDFQFVIDKLKLAECINVKINIQQTPRERIK